MTENLSGRRVDDPGLGSLGILRGERKIAFIARTPGDDVFLRVEESQVIDVLFPGRKFDDPFRGVSFFQKMRDVDLENLGSRPELFPDQVFGFSLDIGPVERGKQEKDGDKTNEGKKKEQKNVGPSQIPRPRRFPFCFIGPPRQLGKPRLSRSMKVSPPVLSSRAMM